MLVHNLKRRESGNPIEWVCKAYFLFVWWSTSRFFCFFSTSLLNGPEIRLVGVRQVGKMWKKMCRGKRKGKNTLRKIIGACQLLLKYNKFGVIDAEEHKRRRRFLRLAHDWSTMYVSWVVSSGSKDVEIKTSGRSVSRNLEIFRTH